ncbi:hypothetical protein P0D72_28855 [Paraburkholderia sediminicola]|uniref:hypothetical protein n=1 Tax=Paraburkholderia sediminicola TaxID=458836 RepID=UPI0038BCA2C7
MASVNYPVNTPGSIAFTSAVAACVFTFLLPFCHEGGYLQPAFLAILAAVCVEVARRNVIRKLVSELNASSAGPLLAVVVNGAPVGEITGTDLIGLKLDALRDPHNYAAQLNNVIGFALRSAAVSLVLVPVVLFWASVISASIAPAPFQATMSAIAHLQTGDIPRAATTLIVLSQTVFILVMGASFSFGVDLGLANVFRRDVHRRIRRCVNCASDGTLSLQSAADASAAPRPAWSSR